MEKNKRFVIFVVGLSSLGLGFTISSAFIDKVSENRLASCQEDYAKQLRFDDSMSKIEKENCEYKVRNLLGDLAKCREEK